MDVATISFLDADAPDRFVESLLGTGFAVLVDHPLAWSMIQQVHADWAAFFASPERFTYLAGERQDGYYPPDDSETAVGAALADLKEFFHWYPWGRRPFDGATADLHREGATFASILLGWVDQRLPSAAREQLSTPLAEMLDGSTRTLLRILHYPPLVGEPVGVRAAAHEDVNLLTVLPAATAAGLEVLRRDGAWMPVHSEPGSVIVNVGDSLQLATSGWLTSTSHRVVNPVGSAARESRYSTPLFLHAADDVELVAGTTALGFLQQRIRQIRGVEIS